jgi:hypothetical protein
VSKFDIHSIDIRRLNILWTVCWAIGRDWNPRKSTRSWKRMPQMEGDFLWCFRVRRNYAGSWFFVIHKIISFVAVCCCTTCFLFTSSSLIPHLLDIILPLNESRPILLPYPSYYFVDERKYFVYIFLHVSLAAQVCMTAILTHDCTVLTYTEHVCSIFAVTG